jgi:Flp pilus assembly protein TadD
MDTAHIEQTFSIHGTGQGEDIAAEFASGSIMRKLGFDRDTLRLGLVVASQQMQRGALVEALETYTSLVICSPLEIDFHVGLATCALRLERLDVALKSASLVIGLAKTDPRGYLLSAQALMMLKEPAAALADARMAMELVATSPLAPDIRRQTGAAAERIVSALSEGSPA